MRQISQVEADSVRSRVELGYSLMGMPSPFRSSTLTMRHQNVPQPPATRVVQEGTGSVSAAAAVLGDNAAAAAGANDTDMSDIEMIPIDVPHEHISISEEDLRLGRPAFISWPG